MSSLGAEGAKIGPADAGRLQPSRRWPRPDQLDLELSVNLTSGSGGLDEEYGWQVWHGAIRAAWEWSPPEGDPPLPSQARGLEDATPELDFADESQRLRVGRLERRVLPLGDEALCQGQLPPVSSGEQLWEAGDVLSGELDELAAASRASFVGLAAPSRGWVSAPRAVAAATTPRATHTGGAMLRPLLPARLSLPPTVR